jgi:mono/diheme cytochrome c family protein
MHSSPSRLAALILACLPVAAASATDYSGYTGEELYHRFCASCHGPALGGDGPVSHSLAVQVPDLTRIAARHQGTFPEAWVYRVIDGREKLVSHGTHDMPVWGLELWREQGADINAGVKTRDAIDKLVAFLRDHQAERRPEDAAR